MEIVYLLFSSVTFGVGYYFGKKEVSTKPVSIEEEMRRKAEKLHQDFAIQMGYNEDIAIGGKVDGR